MVADEWVARVNRVIDSVRDDLRATHTLAELAERAHSSTHNFHRRFREVTGETPAQFVRRSRLERATYLMMASPDRTLTDICLDVGFSNQSDFSRSFRQLYGVAPSRWERHDDAWGASLGQGPEVRIISRPPLRLATVRVRGIFGIDDLTAGYESLLAWLETQNLEPDRSTLFGMSHDNYRTTPSERIHYSFGFDVPAEIEASGAVHIRLLPGFSAAAVRVNGALPDIAAAWDSLYDEWFPGRPWAPSTLPAMKIFRRRPDQLSWKHFDLDCVVAFRQQPNGLSPTAGL